MNRTLPFLTVTLTLLLLSRAGDTRLFAEEVKAKTLKVASVDRKALRSRLAPDVGMTLSDEEGRKIQAHLVSAHGDTVKIQRVDDEREFDVPISTFDEYTENRIRNWIAKDPEAVDFSLSIDAVRTMSGSDSFRTAGRSFKTSKWTYRVTLTNQTRNELDNSQIEYRIIYDDNVDFLRTSAVPGEGKDQQEGQAVDLPSMEFNDQIEFDTPVLEAHTYEYSPTRGEREYSRDTIKGIWIRVVRHGKIIAEYKSNDASMRNLSWDNEDEVEIRITNKFRDSFEPEESPGAVSETK